MANMIDMGSVRGYIIDVSHMIFERNDGKKFLMVNGTSTNVSTTSENITISNGWITAPRAVIDTTSTDTIQYTSNLTDLWLIAGVNNIDMTQGAQTVTAGDYYAIAADETNEGQGMFTIQGEVANVVIEGMELATGETPEEGKYTVTKGTGSTTVHLMLSDYAAGEEIPVFYTKTSTDGYGMEWKGTIANASGRLTRITPLYAEDKEGSEITAYIYDTFEKVKVSQVPGFDNGYKSESSATIEFQSVASKAANATRRHLRVIPA